MVLRTTRVGAGAVLRLGVARNTTRRRVAPPVALCAVVARTLAAAAAEGRTTRPLTDAGVAAGLGVRAVEGTTATGGPELRRSALVMPNAPPASTTIAPVAATLLA